MCGLHHHRPGHLRRFLFPEERLDDAERPLDRRARPTAGDDEVVLHLVLGTLHTHTYTHTP